MLFFIFVLDLPIMVRFIIPQEINFRKVFLAKNEIREVYITMNITTLKVYSHMFRARDREAAQALGNIAFAASES